MKTLENLDLLRKENNFEIYQYPLIYKSSIENLEEYKTIILIGTQSSEKQNLINLFINYYYGVEFSDRYRLEIDDEIDITKEKQNDEYEQMKVYYITPQNEKSGLRIIYTADYSDDLSYDDQSKFDKIYDAIYNSVSLNQTILIGFVIPQQVQTGSFFMLESILGKFSNSLIKNIVFLFPDCTDENPIQKQMLQSKKLMINGILSPILKMIPTMNKIWYLKFNTKALLIKNMDQGNQSLWDMGKNSFQLLLQNYLQYKININKLSEIKGKYDEFFKCLKFEVFIQNLKQKFLELYKRDNIDLEFQQSIQIATKQIGEYIDLNYEKNTRGNNKSEVYYIYPMKNNSRNTQDLVDQVMANFRISIQQHHKQLEELQSLIEDEILYNKGFEEFYDLFKNLRNFMQPEYNKWRQYFKFNSILISINPSQWKYYEHLISKEENLQQEGWEQRVDLLTEKSKLFNYFDDYTKIPNLNQLISQWSDEYLRMKKCPQVQYKKNSFTFNNSNYLGILAYISNNDKVFESFDTIQITKRISKDCDKDFDQFIQTIYQVLTT